MFTTLHSFPQENPEVCRVLLKFVTKARLVAEEILPLTFFQANCGGDFEVWVIFFLKD